MIVTAAVVMSADGRLTKGQEDNIYNWTSKEDQQNFRSLIAGSKTIVMGSGTYIAIRSSLKLTPGVLRIVLTSNPDLHTHQKVDGQLEFSNLPPQQLIARLEAQGANNLLVVGGTKILTSFMRDNLIDRLLITIEPFVFGQGKPLVDKIINAKLKLVDTKQLNQRGTMLLTYQVIK